MNLPELGNLFISRLHTPKLVVVHSEKLALCADDYNAEDVVSESAGADATPWTFRNCAKVNGGGGYIVGALIQAETTAIGGWFSLYLHAGMPTCALGDDVQNTAPILADREFYVGRIDFVACTGLGTNEMDSAEASPSTVGNLPKVFVCAPTSRDLQGVLVIRNVVDLADTTVLHITLWIEQY